MTYSGPIRRFLAFLIDTLVVVFCLALLSILGRLFLDTFRSLDFFGLWWYGALISFFWLYSAILESSPWQATVGKRILKIKVVDLLGQPISFARATSRYFAKTLSRLCFCFGFLMVFFTKKRQALHDKIANTLLILD